MEYVYQLFVALITAFTASVITLHFARKRFVSERLWEKRAEAYGAILEALHNMKRYPNHILDTYTKGADIPDVQKKKLEEGYFEGKHELNRRVAVEQFFFSDDLLTEISTLNEGIARAVKNDDGYSAVDDSWDAINAAQENIRAIAKTHLAVR